MNAIYGLIGYPLGHSFSKEYFQKRFQRENIKAEFRNFEIDSLEIFFKILSEHPQLKGLSVTIPYKQTIIPCLDNIDESVQLIGAVNSIKVERKGGNPYTIGYNTDYYGFGKSLDLFIPEKINSALILGTGGASKAVAYALGKRNISYQFVSRMPNLNSFTYEELNEKILLEHQLIINTTPLGMHPNTETYPQIPYHFLTSQHYMFDLVYNPELTEFLQKGEIQGAHTISGYDMLVYQAERSWKLWGITD